MIKERIIYERCTTLFCKIDAQMIFLQISDLVNLKKNCQKIPPSDYCRKYYI